MGLTAGYLVITLVVLCLTVVACILNWILATLFGVSFLFDQQVDGYYWLAWWALFLVCSMFVDLVFFVCGAGNARRD